MNSKASILADNKGLVYSNSTGEEHKKVFGQYLTPLEVAAFMSSLASDHKSARIDILDPGIGSGILCIALKEKIVETSKTVEHINLVGYEIDSGLTNVTQETLEQLRKWTKARNVALTYEIRFKDFMLDKATVLADIPPLFASLHSNDTHELFDFIISNPPYFKIQILFGRTRNAVNRNTYGFPKKLAHC